MVRLWWARLPSSEAGHDPARGACHLLARDPPGPACRAFPAWDLAHGRTAVLGADVTAPTVARTALGRWAAFFPITGPLTIRPALPAIQAQQRRGLNSLFKCALSFSAGSNKTECAAEKGSRLV